MAIELSGGAQAPDPGTRVLVRCGTEKLRVAGLPLWKRAVLTAWRAGFERILILATGSAEIIRAELAADPRLAARSWEVVSVGDGWTSRLGRPGDRWVVLDDRWVLDAEHLRTLRSTGGPPAGAGRDGPFAADVEDLLRWVADGWRPGEPPAGGIGVALAPPPVYVRVECAADVRAAEDSLVASLARNAETFFARHVDRRISRALSRRLARRPVTPNQITLFSVGLGIAGALTLLRPAYLAGLAGALLFLAHTIIDGCDGEIARLKFEESRFGATLDLIGDNVVHLFLFPCLALRYYFADPNGPFLILGAVAVGGLAVSWLAVYLVHRHPSPLRLRFFELFENREFAYLIVLTAILGRLDWFVWMMSFGIWAFSLGLAAIAAWERRAGR